MMSESGKGGPPGTEAGGSVVQPSRSQLQISAVQVLASSLAAVSAAVVCSFFGVAGTIVGTAVASACATVASSLYAHSLRRTTERLRTVPPRLHPAMPTVPHPTTRLVRPRLPDRFRALPWRRVALASVGVFVLSAAVVTVIELGAGGSLASLMEGPSGGSDRTSFFPVTPAQHHRQPSEAPRPSPSSSLTTPSAPTTATSTAPGQPGNSTPTSSPPSEPSSPASNPLSSLLQPSSQ